MRTSSEWQTRACEDCDSFGHTAYACVLILKRDKITEIEIKAYQQEMRRLKLLRVYARATTR